jgi:dienelactone hydrolase
LIDSSHRQNKNPEGEQVKSETIEYQDGDLTLKGFVAFDHSKAGKRPGILVNPKGFGLGPHAKSGAERLAQLGYVASAADPFGGGAVAKDLDEAMKLATPLMSDTGKLRARAHAGLQTLAAHPVVDTSRMVSIGYCMGGTFSLELACDGAPLRGSSRFMAGCKRNVLPWLARSKPKFWSATAMTIPSCRGNKSQP